MAENSTTRSIVGNLVGAFPDAALLLGDPSALVALGSTNADAALITAQLTVTTAGNGSLGVKLPIITKAGQVCAVYNAASGDNLVYPGTGQSLNGGTATTGAITQEDNSLAIFVATSTTNWGALYVAG